MPIRKIRLLIFHDSSDQSEHMMIEQSRQVVNEGATKAFMTFIPCKKNST